MRRKDREITDFGKIVKIIERCTCVRVGFNDNGEVYIVPLHFGFETIGENIILYFHGAKVGRKTEIIKKNSNVGFEMDVGEKIYTKGSGDIACEYTTAFQSIIGTGNISVINKKDEKIHALNLIMSNLTRSGKWNFDEKMLNAVGVFKLEVTKLSCKVHE